MKRCEFEEFIFTMIPRGNTIKLFADIIYIFFIISVFVPGMSFQSSLMFVGKAKSQP